MLFRLLPFCLLCTILSCLTPAHLFPAKEDVVEEVFRQGIEVHLREPEYSEGILKTDKGGLITGPEMRIQAQNIIYTRKMVDGKPLYTIEAEGDLQIEFGDYIFVGKRLEYDFQEKSGIIYDGRTFSEPWFFGGEYITLRPDGSYIIYNGFVTTSENYMVDWKITSEKTTLYPNQNFSAKNVKFQFGTIPIFWLPSLKANLDYIFDVPIRASARWGGRQGPRFEVIYELFSWNRWKTFLRFDYRLNRGPGIGFETYYRSADHLETFEAINYIARDSSLDDRKETFRCRFQGNYSNLLFDKKVSVNLTYDKLSDKDMALEYRDSSLDLAYAGITQLQVRRQDYNWIANFLAKVRINRFQTIKQELPTFVTSWRPYEIASTGIITDHLFNASYLDFKYSNNQIDDHDYNSARIEYQHRFYRPFHIGPINLTPEVEGLAIYYGNVPEESKRWLTLGIFSIETNAPLFRPYDTFKHIVIPYARYDYITYPTSPPRDHFIFDIEDGWFRLNMLTFGLKQNFYQKNSDGLLKRSIQFDLYARAFFDTPAISQIIPKVYLISVINPTDYVRHTLDTAWDLQHHKLDHFNFRTEWTVSPDLAIATEYRHRDEYDWRKADRTNFILDSYRSPRELVHSSLSDRRDTLLLHFFYRFHPKWACEIQTRGGWNRKHEPNYIEYEVDLVGTIRSAWVVRWSYQHRENDHHRFSVSFNIGLTKPDQWKIEHLVPELEF